MLVSSLHEPEKTKKPRLVLVRARTAVKILLVLIDMAREKSNPTHWNNIFKLRRQCRGA